ncbi:hypothetical protein TRICI_000375 [Trichomonascus ciferrii]|uniref:J domain-containing protein n=1 Tax=Trichomonascus ciferrii TaxID=44093 RepID=A0A642VDK3_9ASCO|nr:hypothetical protein TRICI_000375 [Trichomonascus ciferrii]
MRLASVLLAATILLAAGWTKLVQLPILTSRSLDQASLKDYTSAWERNYRKYHHPDKYQDSAAIAISAFDRIQRVLDASDHDRSDSEISTQQTGFWNTTRLHGHYNYNVNDSPQTTSSATMGVTLALAACFLLY